MEAEREEGLAQDIDMSLEENMAQEKPGEVKQTYKSFKYALMPLSVIFTLQRLWAKTRTLDPLPPYPPIDTNYIYSANMPGIRKKYRKMRIKFDEKMRQSNELFVEEQLAVETAKRLAQENE